MTKCDIILDMMRMFWAFYGFLPMVLFSLFFGLNIAASTAAAPGVTWASDTVRFVAAADTLDPNQALVRVNQERASHDLDVLYAHEGLGKIAQARADDMAARSFYAHKNPDGKFYYDYFASHGINAGYNCENLDLVFAPNLEQVIHEWNASVKGHRECMMNDKTTLAGYGSAKMELINYDGSTTTAYLVVAIHAEIPIL